MADINTNQVDGGQNEPNNVPINYEALSEVAPERQLAVVDGSTDDIKNKTAGEQQMESPKLSDMQSALKVLFPKLKHYLDIIQVSRILPDIYNALLRILVKDMIIEFPDMSVAECIVYVNTAMSIAIDGEGRIDVLGLAGAAREQEVEKTKTSVGSGII